MAYHINEEFGDIEYEVINGNELVLKVKGGAGGGGGGSDIYLIKEDDATEPTDKNVFSALRTLKELAKVASEGGYWKLMQDKDGKDYIYSSLPVVTSRGVTAYASNDILIPSVFDGLPIDNITIFWETDPTTGQRVLKAQGGGGTGDFDPTVMWTLLSKATSEQINPTHLTDALKDYVTTSELNKKWTQDNNKISNWDTAFGWGNHADAGYALQTNVTEELKKYVTLADEQIISGLKHFTNGLSIGATKHKIYEQDGVVFFDGDLAVTGGITAYALGSKDVSTIMDGVVVDGTTIAKVNGVLKVLNAGGGEAGSVAWENVTNKPSWIGSTKPSYNWSEIGSKPTTLGGYGITDAYTKTDSDNRFVNVSGDTMTGHLIINGSYANILTISDTGTTSALIRFKNQSGVLGYIGVSSTDLNFRKTDTSTVYKVWHEGNDGVGSGLDADMLDGLHGNSFFRESLLAKQNLDANSLDTFYTQYSPIGDMNTWDGTSFTNFPKSKPAGGFSLLVLREGGYKKQIYSDYNDNHLYIRTQYYSQSVKWNNWSTVALTTDNVASATKLQTARAIWGQSFDGAKNIEKTSPIYVNAIIDSNNNYCFASDGNANIAVGTTAKSHTIRLDTQGGTRLFILNNGNIGIGTTSPAYKLDVSGDIHASGWLRTTGNYGWYSQTHGGGWYMTDSDYVRVYNDKGVVAHRYVTEGYAGNSWNSGYGVFSAKIINNNAQTPLLLAYRSGTSDTGDNRLFAMELLNSGGSIRFSMGGNTQMEISKGSSVTVTTNFLSKGGVTAYSSDQRAKTVIEQINLSLKQVANAPTIRFKWNGWKIKDDNKTHIGGIAQYIQKLLPEAVLEADNFLNMDYATTGYIFSVQTARHLVKTETRVEKLEKRVKKLEKQLKKLGYEEANIMDD